MKLELKHLSPYLPYGLRGIYNLQDVVSSYKNEKRVKELSAYNVDFFLNYCKPILRPISELKDTSKYYKEHLITVLKYDIYSNYGYAHVEVESYPYLVILWICENHFDVFGLIEAGLAIDINTL